VKIVLHIGEQALPASYVAGERHVTVPPFTCSACGQCTDAVLGGPRRIAGHDEYRADAHAGCCLAVVGELRVRVATLFGLEEDEAVGARCRVYS
jgi:hypothetical protein